MRGAEESAGRVEWVEKGVMSDLLPKVTSKNKKEGVSESSYLVWFLGFEVVPLTKRQEAELEVAELIMVRLLLGVTRMDKIRNEYIRRTSKRGNIEMVRTCAEERCWVNQVKNAGDGAACKRKRERSKKRFMDAVRKNMKVVGVTEEDAEQGELETDELRR